MALLEAGLPDVTGTINYSHGSDAQNRPAAASGIEGFNGCFSNADNILVYGIHGNITQTVQMQQPKTPYNLKFAASSSNNIYGHGDTVQPPAISLIPQIKF